MDMSSEQTFSTGDLRSTAQDYKRDAARKHKWALGSVATTGRVAGGKPRPHRPSETQVSHSYSRMQVTELIWSRFFNFKRKETKSAIAALQNGAKIARKQDMLEGTAISDDSSNSASDHEDVPSPPACYSIMYSFDATQGPSQGSQILNAALAKAVEKFEERETVKLVKEEYEVLNDDGESMGQSPVKKGKSKVGRSINVPDADEDYEFV